MENQTKINELESKLNSLFGDINKYYSDFNQKVSLFLFNKELLNENSLVQIFQKYFSDREFNVDVTKTYLKRIFKDYDLTIIEVEEYRDELLKRQKRIDEQKKKNRKKLIFGLSIIIPVLIASFFAYNSHLEKQFVIEETLRKEKNIKEETLRKEKNIKEETLRKEKNILAQENDLRFRGIIKSYLKETDNKKIEEIISYWSDKPRRYWNINNDYSSDYISINKINTTIDKALYLNSYSENIIDDIQKIKDRYYRISVLFKFTSKKTSITKHIESQFVIVFDESGKIIEEYGAENEKTRKVVYDSSTIKRLKSSSGIYEGTLLNGLMHGKGKFVYDNGNIYEGDWIRNKRTGKGKYTSKSGEIYEGSFIDGNRQGKGKITYPNGNSYDGDWSQNKKNGKGKMIYDGDLYEGDFIDDKFNGIVKVVYADDSGVYEGEWKNDFRIGRGKFILNENVFEVIWDDDFKSGKGEIISSNFKLKGKFDPPYMSGEGEIVYSNGITFIGYWNEGLELDEYYKGKMIYPNGDIYEGKFLNNQRNGKGKMIFKNGDVYEGEWSENSINGIGEMTYNNGDRYNGRWLYNKRNGLGTMFWSDGSWYIGEFINGEWKKKWGKYSKGR
tara:strand:- start:868 stop:2712 length:1845 start_codon:yes stop_codon:yes gene_type:complete